MRHRAVIFDLDGTLLDTLEDIADSVNKALGHLGLPQHELDAYRYFVGEGLEALASRALPQSHRDAAMVDESRRESIVSNAYYAWLKDSLKSKLL